jgi:hypothetical protein
MHGNTAVTTSDPARLHNLPAEHVTNLVSGIVTAVGYRDAGYHADRDGYLNFSTWFIKKRIT